MKHIELIVVATALVVLSMVPFAVERARRPVTSYGCGCGTGAAVAVGEWDADLNCITWDANAATFAAKDNIVVLEEDSSPYAAITVSEDLYTSVTFWLGDGREVGLTWADGPLAIVGDPNDYTEAAKLFLTEIVGEAALSIVAEDPNAIRRLARSGRLCAVLGHQWRWDVPGFEQGVGYMGGEVCGLCGEQRVVTIPCEIPDGWIGDHDVIWLDWPARGEEVADEN